MKNTLNIYSNSSLKFYGHSNILLYSNKESIIKTYLYRYKDSNIAQERPQIQIVYKEKECLL
jgi:hypothetical protein